MIQLNTWMKAKQSVSRSIAVGIAAAAVLLTFYATSNHCSILRADDLEQEVKSNTVEIAIRFNGNGEDIELKKIQWKDGMTVLSLMTQLQKEKKIRFKHHGTGITAFLTEMGGVKNSGSGGDNWIFRVNSKLGKKSFGVTKLSAGDKVNWTFGKYRPNGK